LQFLAKHMQFYFIFPLKKERKEAWRDSINKAARAPSTRDINALKKREEDWRTSSSLGAAELKTSVEAGTEPAFVTGFGGRSGTGSHHVVQYWFHFGSASTLVMCVNCLQRVRTPVLSYNFHRNRSWRSSGYHLMDHYLSLPGLTRFIK
jgi:hypothetical protein